MVKGFLKMKILRCVRDAQILIVFHVILEVNVIPVRINSFMTGIRGNVYILFALLRVNMIRVEIDVQRIVIILKMNWTLIVKSLNLRIFKVRHSFLHIEAILQNT